MKLSTILILIAFTLFGGVAIYAFAHKSKEVSKVYSLTDFENLSIEAACDVVYTQSDEYFVEVLCAQETLEFLDVKNSSSTLHIGIKEKSRIIKKMKRVKVTVSCPRLAAIKVLGSSTFTSEKAVNGESIKINLQGSGELAFNAMYYNKVDMQLLGSGDIKLGKGEIPDLVTQINGSGSIAIADLVAQNTTCTIKGSADMYLTGENSGKLLASIYGSGDINGANFKTKEADVKIFGSGDMKVSCFKKLMVSINGSGSLGYIGSPEVTKNINGSGDVNQLHD